MTTKKSAFMSSIAALEYISTPMATLVTVITLILTGQPVTPVNVFTFLSFINVLSGGFCASLSYASTQAYDAYVSLSRIQDFLLLNNLDSTKTTINPPEGIEESCFSMPSGGFIVVFVESRLFKRRKSCILLSDT